MGFFSKLLSFFSKKPTAASQPGKPAATAAAQAAPAAASAPAAKPAAGAAPAAAPAPAGALRPFTGEMISVPLAGVLDALPADLKALVANAPDASVKFQVPLQIAIDGLPKGAVKVSIAELRRGSPAGTLQTASEHDDKMVSLPLKDILPQIKPEHLKTKSTKTVEVPDSIAPVFGRKE